MCGVKYEERIILSKRTLDTFIVPSSCSVHGSILISDRGNRLRQCLQSHLSTPQSRYFRR